MRVAIVTESFLPEVNGVTNSVLRVLDHLARTGGEAVVVAPGPVGQGPHDYAGAPVVRVPSVGLPGYSEKRVGLPSRRVEAVLEEFRPDVVHLASPFVLAAQGAFVAARLGLPMVAVYQTDVAGFARHYHLGLTQRAAWRWIRRVHVLADLTLAPSTAACADLRRHGVPRVGLWPRGVDTGRFSPARRDPRLRAELAPRGEVLVGYVGRLAPEKQVQRLVALADLPGVRLVVVGEGPLRDTLRRRLPTAVLPGFLDGERLAATYAALDVFVHPGEDETFCQSAQEALASGVPVVAVASGGPCDLVGTGENGLLVPPGDAAGLRAAAGTLAADPAGRRRMGQAARRSVAARTWPRLCADLVGHYVAVIEASERRSA